MLFSTSPTNYDVANALSIKASKLKIKLSKLKVSLKICDKTLTSAMQQRFASMSAANIDELIESVSLINYSANLIAGTYVDYDPEHTQRKLSDLCEKYDNAENKARLAVNELRIVVTDYKRYIDSLDNLLDEIEV